LLFVKRGSTMHHMPSNPPLDSDTYLALIEKIELAEKGVEEIPDLVNQQSFTDEGLATYEDWCSKEITVTSFDEHIKDAFIAGLGRDLTDVDEVCFDEIKNFQIHEMPGYFNDISMTHLLFKVGRDIRNRGL